jgi:hypothetical protein
VLPDGHKLLLGPADITLFDMNTPLRIGAVVCGILCLLAAPEIRGDEASEEKSSLPKAFINGEGPGWKELTLDDFVNVNCAEDTWSVKDGMIHSTGAPIGVIRTKDKYTNLELVVEWQHLKPAGNSGVFLWATDEGLEGLKPNQLPSVGIEVQILDHGYAERYEKSQGKKPDWFTTNGDVFPVGKSKMKPFPPISPDGSRSFPSKDLSKGSGEWNHYYVRAINGEVRLWVNGEEVSGGTECQPASGYLCLESEGSPILFRNLRVRELP